MSTNKANISSSKPKSLPIFKTVVLALLIGVFIRFFLFQPFHIPSRSMEPNLIRGDYVVTNKFVYGFGPHSFNPIPIGIDKRVFGGQPKRGDIIVFKVERRKGYFIKRVIGLPGDQIQLRNGALYINGTQQDYTRIDNGLPETTGAITARILQETLPVTNRQYLIADGISGSEGDDTPIYEVPYQQYFFLGDNRDYSYDSRYSVYEGGVGMIQARDIIGRAEFVLLSAEQGFNLFLPKTWNRLRGERSFKGLR